MKTFSNIFCSTYFPCLNIIYIPFIFLIIAIKLYLYKEFFITIMMFLLLLLMILLLILLMMNFFFSFILKLNSGHPCNRHWSRITALCTNTTVLKHVETLSTQMALKPVIAWNRVPRGHVNLVIASVKYIRSFFKFSFLISLFKRFPF